MLHFNELYITDDNKQLVVDVEIDGMPEFSSCYIDNITLSLGKECGKNDKQVVTIYERGDAPIGDLDGDGVLTKTDANLWKLLLDACGSDRVKYNSLKDQYYISNFIDVDDNVYEEKYLTQQEYDIYNNVITNYEYYSNAGKLIMYFTDVTGDKSTQIPTASKTLPGDLNNDGEVNVADINVLIDYILKEVNSSNTITSDSILINRNRVRFCLSPDSEQLNGLFSKVSEDGKVSLAKEFPNELFIVTATANCDDTSALANLSCGEDTKCITGVAYNGQPLYDIAVRYADNYGNTCDTKDMAPFLDWLLRYYGFIFALENGDICQAQYYWSTYLTNGTVTSSSFSKSCGCHGTYYQRL